MVNTSTDHYALVDVGAGLVTGLQTDADHIGVTGPVGGGGGVTVGGDHRRC